MFNIQMETRKLPLWFATLLSIVIPILGMALGVGVIFLSGLSKTTYGNLIVNVFFLTGVVVLARLFRLSAEDLGLKVIKGLVQIHVILSLVTLALYILFYIFVFRISTIKPFSSSTLWGLVTYLIVVIAEDVYFRGALYSVFEKRFSAKIALIITSLLFGLFHAQQGVRSIISKI